MLRRPSSGSVRVRWPKSKDEVLSGIRKIATTLVQKGGIHKIWVFGSYVNDEFMHYSDVDLCIVVADDSEWSHDKIMKEVFEIRSDLNIEIHYYKESEFISLKEKDSSFVSREIVDKGIKVYP